MTGSGHRAHHTDETSLALFDSASQAAAAQVIRHYSNSFGLGTRLLPPVTRTHIASIYAMVRIADEIVDTYRGPDTAAVLDAFEVQVHQAMNGRFSADVIAHAFGVTARATGITRELVDPFFASMRMDLTVTEHDAASFDTYVYGSAEVIGEMCLAAFLATGDGPADVPDELRAGARKLGSAYQKINFLRDLGADLETRGRVYFPGLDVTEMSDADVASLVIECRAELAAARATLPGLPLAARRAVLATVMIYEELLERISKVPAQKLVTTRVSVPRLKKLSLAASAMRAAKQESVNA
ncbi:phytoene/squalene synthase family protein [Demequina sediminicola]|uniref:phytoene/squalene synthase family protein n=1 Tax=Demequina sediminicola TaxID=1095026 RepID=UPI0007837AFF|nr:phytoene/squalene synthase family protein [Demequina sediminicola]